MAYEHKPGSFTLFKNDKGGNDKRPDYRGDGADLDGMPIEVAAWIKKSEKGAYMSCTFKPKEVKAPYGESKSGHVDDEDVPFAPIYRGIKWNAY